mgnify:CR=1 FL=1
MKIGIISEMQNSNQLINVKFSNCTSQLEGCIFILQDFLKFKNFISGFTRRFLG